MTDWPAIVGEHGPLVWRTAYRLLGGHADAADCFQETFVSAMDVAGREDVENWPGSAASAGDSASAGSTEAANARGPVGGRSLPTGRRWLPVGRIPSSRLLPTN